VPSSQDKLAFFFVEKSVGLRKKLQKSLANARKDGKNAG